MLPVWPVHRRRRLHHPLHQLLSRKTPQGVPVVAVKLLHREYTKNIGENNTPQLQQTHADPKLRSRSTPVICWGDKTLFTERDERHHWENSQ
jgi:hypothetical protein